MCQRQDGSGSGCRGQLRRAGSKARGGKREKQRQEEDKEDTTTRGKEKTSEEIHEKQTAWFVVKVLAEGLPVPQLRVFGQFSDDGSPKPQVRTRTPPEGGALQDAGRQDSVHPRL